MKKLVAWALGAIIALGAAAFAALYFIPAVQDHVIAGMIASEIGPPRMELVGDDALRVAICGSGSPMPDPDRASACNLVMAGGRIFVVDVGPGSWARVARWRLPVERVGAVFLTHFHSDHLGDLGEANLQSWVAARPEPLVVYGGPGVERVVAGFNDAYAMDRSHRIAHHGADYLPERLGVMEARAIAGADGAPLPLGSSVVVFEADGITVTAFPVEHGPVTPAYGYRFDYKGRSVVFSGDTHRTDELVRMSKGADLLVHEAMLKDVVGWMRAAAEAKGQTRIEHIFHDIPDYHASPRDAALTAQAAGVRHLVLSHLIPPIPHWLGKRLFLRDTGVEGVETHLAWDGMLIELPAGGDEVRFGAVR